MTKQVAEKLLKEGKVKMKGCRSLKTGKTYNATVVMHVDETGRTQYGLEFENRNKGKER